MQEIHFYNNFNNGDVFFSRKIIDEVTVRFPDQKIIYHHGCPFGILKDYKNIIEQGLNQFCVPDNTISQITENTVYINTWYGQGNAEFFKLGNGTTLKTIFLITKNIFQYFGWNDFPSEDCFFYPKIYLENEMTIENLNPQSVLICNDFSKSGQSNNIDLDFITSSLAGQFTEINFFVTRKFESFSPNIKFTDDLFPNRPNLIEISKLSNTCKFIIGRSSGPYSYSMSYDNIIDPSKILISLSNNYITGIWDERFHKCQYFHNSSSSIQKVLDFLSNIISSEINK